MSWIEIRKRMRDYKLSYEWLCEMLYRWCGVSTTRNAIASAMCRDVSHDLRDNIAYVLTKYERVINGKD